MNVPVVIIGAGPTGLTATIVEHIQASRRLHAAVAHATHDVFAKAGVACRRPQAAFYLYPDLEALHPALAERGIGTGVALADHLLDEHGIGVLAGEHFGDTPESLRFRAATSLLYGRTADERWMALRSDDPVSLPWISAALDRVTDALAALGDPR